jgi:hypothetical protein
MLEVHLRDDHAVVAADPGHCDGHRLTAWANEGVDIHAKLPLLSAYLGHQNIIGTEAYLKATPQLLELASSRFEQHLRDACPPR